MSEVNANALHGSGIEAVLQARDVHGGIHVHTGGHRVDVPQQVRPPAKHFVNRAAELGALTELLTDHPDDEPGPGVIVLVGPPGIGTSALAARWLTSNSSLFPDGVFHADLAGGAVGDVLGQLLRGSGVAVGAVPDTPAERTLLWRTITATRRVAVLLDHLQPEQDPQPLLPAGAGCVALVTSRQPRLDLLCDGAHQIRVGALDRNAAIELVTRHLKPLRQVDETAAGVAELAGWCGGHPRALRLATASVLARPSRPLTDALAALRQELARSHTVEDRPMTPDHAASRAISASVAELVDALSPVAARLFPVLGLLPGGAVCPELVAAVANVGVDQARDVVGEWTDGSLLDSAESGSSRVLPQVAELARAEQTDRSELDAPRVIVERALQWYQLAVRTAGIAVLPARRVLPCAPTVPAMPLPPALVDRLPALAWLDRERLVIGQAVATAVDLELDEIAVRLVDALQPLLIMHKYPEQAVTLERLALRAAQRCGDEYSAFGITKRLVRLCVLLHDFAQAQLLNQQQELQARMAGNLRWLAATTKSRGVIAAGQQQWRSAADDFEQAALLLRKLGRARSEGLALIELGKVLVHLPNPADAIEHLRRARRLLTGLEQPDDYNAARADITHAHALIRAAVSTDPATADEILALLNGALETVRAHDSVHEQIRAHDVFAEYFQQRGDEERARRHHSCATDLRLPAPGAN